MARFHPGLPWPRLKPDTDSCLRAFAGLGQSRSACPACLFGQLHHIVVIVGPITAILQLLDANRNVSLQRGKLSAGMCPTQPPAEEFDLFVGIQFGGRCFDVLHGAHV
jgi:hypothetical protein